MWQEAHILLKLPFLLALCPRTLGSLRNIRLAASKQDTITSEELTSFFSWFSQIVAPQDGCDGSSVLPLKIHTLFKICLFIYSFRLPGGSDDKESTYNVEDAGSVPGLGRSPGGGHSNPLKHSCLENPQGQKSLVGCNPTELDTTEWLSTAQHLFIRLRQVLSVACKLFVEAYGI